MRKLTLALLLAALILAFAVVPAFAIVHPRAPICEGKTNSGGAAGGVAGFGASGNSDKGPPFPAQGEANSGENSPANGSDTDCPL